LPATANEHYQSWIKVFHLVGVELHFVWPLSADLLAMGNPLQEFFLSPAISTTLQVMEARKRFHHSKVVVCGYDVLHLFLNCYKEFVNLQAFILYKSLCITI